MKKNLIFLRGIKIKTIIGINRLERKNKQNISINCLIEYNSFVDIKENISYTVNYKFILKEIKTFVKKSNFYLLETLCNELSNFLIKRFKIKYILLKIDKINVLKDIKKVGVIIERFI